MRKWLGLGGGTGKEGRGGKKYSVGPPAASRTNVWEDEKQGNDNALATKRRTPPAAAPWNSYLCRKFQSKNT